MPSETVLSQNTQQFDDDEIVDNFGGEDRDDGVPIGLGGEKGKQSEPASSTLEADIVSGKKQTKQASGDDLPQDDSPAGGEPEPVPEAAGDDGAGEPVPKPSEEPELPVFPPALLRMAGFETEEDAKKAGFKDSESLLAAVEWRGRTLSKPPQPSRSSYLETPEAKPKDIPAGIPPEGDGTAFKPFKPANPDLFDEELLKLLDDQHAHYAAQYEEQRKQFDAKYDELSSRLKGREEDEQRQLLAQSVEQFDKAVQGLGKDWEAEFGTGGGDELFGKPDAKSVTAAQNRIDLFDAVNVLRRTNAEQGGKPMSLEQEMQWALMQRYPEKFRQQLLRESAARAESRRGVQASRPTARKTPLAGKNERLLSTLQTKYPSVDFSKGEGDVEGDI